MSVSKSSPRGQVHPASRARRRSATMACPAALLAASMVGAPAALTFTPHRGGALLVAAIALANALITAAAVLAGKLGPDWLRLRAVREFTQDQRWNLQNAPTPEDARQLTQQQADLLTALLTPGNEGSPKAK